FRDANRTGRPGVAAIRANVLLPHVLEDQFQQFVVHRFGLVRRSLRNRIGHAMMQVIAHQRPPDTPKRLLHRRDLLQNIGAIPVVLHHLLQAPDLPFDAPQPVEVRSLDVRVHARRFPRFRFSAHDNFSFRRRRLLVTTLTELNAIAALASTGLSSSPNAGYNTPAAIGIPMMLYPNAQPRFCRIVRMVRRESAMAVTTASTPPRISVMSLASAATSVPLAQQPAIPTSARARAGASLTPSPTIAIAPPRSRLMRSISATLPWGRRPARTSSMPT